MQPDRRLPDRWRPCPRSALWRLASGHFGLSAAVVSDHPGEPAAYKRRLAGFLAMSHVTIEVHRCPDHAREAA
jgi:hypothetical protein